MLALADCDWQTATRQRLQADGERLRQALAPLGEVKATPLFATLNAPSTGELHEHLVRRAILTRRYESNPLLRFGLPPDAAGWERLSAGVAAWLEGA